MMHRDRTFRKCQKANKYDKGENEGLRTPGDDKA